ncbi:MAG: 1,6-anhydro-N-acetylmuramyl-L-alanine amidase AmpD [Magnetococcales bacterium]|nr:1,6-anhydro-N-acetylmuramyl-L-alanine amidase AmpD [Magnetococcales bacterium]
MRFIPFQYKASPHCDCRPEGIEIDLLVIHAISLPPGEFGGCGVDDLFLGCLNSDAHPFFAEIAGLRVAAHFFIQRCGALTQYVPTNKRAWHAGVSQWQQRTQCNDFSIGIELEGDESTPFEKEQYQSLARLTRSLQNRYPAITQSGIVGHQDIAPGRKWDPGPCFDWLLFWEMWQTALPSDQWPLIWD